MTNKKHNKFAQGFDRFQRSMCDVHFNWDLKPNTPSSYEGGAQGARYGDAIFTEVWLDPTSGVRNSDKINGACEDYIVLIFVTEGGIDVSQGKRDICVAADEFFIWDAIRPCQFNTLDRMKCVSILFPRFLVKQHFSGVDDLFARKISATTSVAGSILKPHVLSLHKCIGQALPYEYSGLIHSTLDILSASVESKNCLTITRHQEILLQRIKSYLDENFSNPECTSEMIANDLGVTPRYVRKILSDVGITFSNLLKQKRLHFTAYALRSTSFAHDSVTTIAYNAGFSDMAHFSRVFKTEFGCSPSKYRSAANPQMC